MGLSITIAEKLQDEILLGFNNVLYVNLKPYSQYGVIGLQTPYYSVSNMNQRCRWVFKSGWSSSNTVGIIGPLLVGIGLSETPNSRWAKAHPAHPLTASL